ncbi:hypothetical protein JMK10_00065 [Rhodovulum sulfidophilum]|uniref:hypothetical protein n=1 Tax=Rhodovulum sulfidophilum TaxID=35806 RepID=UPI00192474E8|nr:hypothetical protein [Rhodovulum sulfidophilum]MBL3576149.1 hypothetical protein [Rhodovulum sulfidophilum]MCE8433098.1 hypothetical protein [Rhodovulum sulfidophilum]MCF4115259.1 hypothetical protein [Rhodovulum sulfidophilum]
MKGFHDTLYGKALGGRHGPLLVDLWREILRMDEKHSEGCDLQVCDQLTLEFLHDLREVEAEDCWQMCWGLGPTVYGAVVVSRCRSGNGLAGLGGLWLSDPARCTTYAAGASAQPGAHARYRKSAVHCANQPE